MLQDYIISYVGVDRPGLVDHISRILRDCGGSWQSSRSANLAGMFSGMVHINIDQDKAPALRTALEGLQSDNLQVLLTPIAIAKPQAQSLVEIKVVGADRKGILSELTGILSNLNINLEELETRVSPAPMSSELTFIAVAQVSVPAHLELDRVREALEMLSDDLIVEINHD